MIRLELAGQREWRSGENPYPEEFRDSSWPLRHQVRTAQAADADIVINTHNTGTGKTRAALLRLLEAVRSDGHQRRNCLLIAPTNELLRQHEGDVQLFVARNSLPHEVIRVDAQRVHDLELPELRRQAEHLTGEPATDQRRGREEADDRGNQPGHLLLRVVLPVRQQRPA